MKTSKRNIRVNCLCKTGTPLVCIYDLWYAYFLQGLLSELSERCTAIKRTETPLTRLMCNVKLLLCYNDKHSKCSCLAGQSSSTALQKSSSTLLSLITDDTSPWKLMTTVMGTLHCIYRVCVRENEGKSVCH